MNRLTRPLDLCAHLFVAIEDAQSVALEKCGKNEVEVVTLDCLEMGGRRRQSSSHSTLSICQLNEEQSARLASLVDIIAQPAQIMTDSDRSVQAHIKEVAWHLESMAKEIGSLPKDSSEEFSFGLRMNQMPHSCKGEKEYFYPLEVLRDFWFGLLSHAPEPHPDNVVPFGGHRRYMERGFPK